MLTYRLLLVVELLGVLGYAGGLIAAFVATPLVDRKRAVHAVASPALAVTWIAGYLLTRYLHRPLLEPWILGGLGLSLMSQLALEYSMARDRVTSVSNPAGLRQGLVVGPRRHARRRAAPRPYRRW